MTMKLKLDDIEHDIEINRKSDEYEVIIDGSPSNFSFVKGGDNLYSIKVGDQIRNIFVAENSDELYLCSDGCYFTLTKVHDTGDTDYASESKSLDRDEVRPPMPGSIVKIEVSEGQKVNEGDALIIVEAMKMETTLYSSINGIVTAVNVAPGEQVASDKILVVVEKELEN